MFHSTYIKTFFFGSPFWILPHTLIKCSMRSAHRPIPTTLNIGCHLFTTPLELFFDSNIVVIRLCPLNFNLISTCFYLDRLVFQLILGWGPHTIFTFSRCVHCFRGHFLYLVSENGIDLFETNFLTMGGSGIFKMAWRSIEYGHAKFFLWEFSYLGNSKKNSSWGVRLAHFRPEKEVITILQQNLMNFINFGNSKNNYFPPWVPMRSWRSFGLS